MLRCVIFAFYRLKIDIYYATNRNCVLEFDVKQWITSILSSSCKKTTEFHGFRNKISTFDELNKLTTQHLHMICQQDYNDTMKMYFVLKDNGINFQAWEDQYLFEILSRKIAKTLDRRYRIYTVSQLCSCAEIFIDSMPPSLLPSIKKVLEEFSTC